MSPVLHLLPLLYNSQIYLSYFCITTFPSRIHTVTFSACMVTITTYWWEHTITLNRITVTTYWWEGNTHLLSICSLLPPTSGNKHSWFVFLMYYYSYTIFTLLSTGILFKGYCLINFRQFAFKWPISRQLKQDLGCFGLRSAPPPLPWGTSLTLMNKIHDKSLVRWSEGPIYMISYLGLYSYLYSFIGTRQDAKQYYLNYINYHLVSPKASYFTHLVIWLRICKIDFQNN